MKTYKWFFLILTAVVFVDCSSDSEDEYLGNWISRTEFLEGGRSYPATFVIGDKGYLCGGWNGKNARHKELYEFDNTSPYGSWRKLADFAGAGRQQAVGFTVNGKGYVGTGWDGYLETAYNDFYEYDPAANIWREVAPLPGNVRYGAVAFTLTYQGKEYGFVGTGRYETEDDTYPLNDFFMYDPDKGEGGTWTEIDPLPGYKRYGAVVFVVDNAAYICTGQGSGGLVTDFWKFDPDGKGTFGVGAWTKLRNIDNMNTDEDYDDDYDDLIRYYASSFTIPVGGTTRGHIVLGGPSRSSVWEYDHLTDLWEQRTSFYGNAKVQYREGAVAFSFPNTKRAFVGMGSSAASTHYTDFREFIPLVDDDTNDD